MINRPVGFPGGRIMKIIDEVEVDKICECTCDLFTPTMNMPPSPN